ncbi:tetratricopeptide repeat protein [Streptomyces sp. NPDC051105]|uniref:tetratricopeptide repeat protein n=1 Tax=Streptomyces sp. NPDC051105 TaxID=3154843 RepID=UPI00344A848A
MRDVADTAPRGEDGDTHGEHGVSTTVAADHLDFRAGRFHGDVVGKKVEHHHYVAHGHSALRSLPGPVSGFVGRHDELRSLLETLGAGTRSHGTVLISAVAGLGGVGKTALALQAAHAAQDQGLFPAGAVFLDLHGYDDVPLAPEQALEQLLRALAVPAGHIPASADARAGLYRSVLAGTAEERGALLIVVDNASHPSQVRPLLPGHPRHRVLVTSRDTLSQLGAHLLHLGVLPAEQGVEVLATAVTAADPRDTRIAREPEDARRLGALCGQLPLALHIAAALLINDPGKPVAELADELADAAGPLDNLYDGERAIRATFDTSYDRLAPGPARLFRLLAIAPGPDTGTEALGALAGAEPAPREVDALVRAHLIETGSRRGRWRMHDLVRAYGAARAMADASSVAEVHAARDRLLGRYQERVTDGTAHLKPTAASTTRHNGFTDREEALAWLDTERDGLVAAAQWAADPAHAEPAVRLALSLYDYLGWRRHYDDAAIVYRYAARGAHLLGDQEREALAYDNLGIALRQLRRLDEAVDAHHRALRTCRELPSPPGTAREAPRGEGRALYNLGNAYLEARRYDRALTAYLEAETLLRGGGVRSLAAMAQNGIGVVHLMTGHFAESVRRLDSAQNVFRSLGETIPEGIATNNRGRARRALGQFEASCRDHLRSIALFRPLGQAERVATACNDLALALREMGRTAEALERHAEALNLVRQHTERYREAMVLNDLGETLCRAGRPEEAADCHGRALALFRDIFHDPYGQARSLDLYAAAVEGTGALDEARRARREAAARYGEAGADAGGEGGRGDSGA